MEDVFKHLQNIWKKLKVSLAHVGAQKNSFTNHLESLINLSGNIYKIGFTEPFTKESKETWSPNTPHPRPTRRTLNHTQGNYTYQLAQNLKKRGNNRGELIGSVQ